MRRNTSREYAQHKRGTHLQLAQGTVYTRIKVYKYPPEPVNGLGCIFVSVVGIWALGSEVVDWMGWDVMNRAV